MDRHRPGRPSGDPGPVGPGDGPAGRDSEGRRNDGMGWAALAGRESRMPQYGDAPPAPVPALPHPPNRVALARWSGDARSSDPQAADLRSDGPTLLPEVGSE